MGTPNILLVDDDKDFTVATQMILETNGFKVITAQDGEEGLQKAKKLRPDLIILDVMLPKKDGYFVCHELKERVSTSDIPIIILTSLSNKSGGKKGVEIIAKGHKAEAYLEKPVEARILVNQVNSLLQKMDEENKSKPKKKILIIDDDPDFIAGVKTILDDKNYTVLVSYTGEEGITKAIEEDPSLILLDVMLPGKDGYAVCKELKNYNKTKTIPIVMLTSVGEGFKDPDFAKAIAVTHEASNYLEKPVTSKELLKTIRWHIGPMRRLI
ncbi:response regulator transcription factor [bacterium]